MRKNYTFDVRKLADSNKSQSATKKHATIYGKDPEDIGNNNINFILYLNVQSINNKQNVLEVELNNENPMFISITETWLKEFEVSNFPINGYHVVHSYCREIYKGGGTALWAKNGLETTPLCISKLNVEKDFEYCGCEYKNMTSCHRIITIYRSPTGNFQNFCAKLQELLDEIFTVNVCLWVTGDFNIDFKTLSREREEVLDIFAQYGLNSIVEQDTRVTAQSCTRIDNIFSNIETESKVKDTPLSDHRYITVKVNHNLYTDRKNMKAGRNYSKKNKQKFSQLLKNENWDVLYNHKTCNDKYNKFESIVQNHFLNAFPLQNQKSKAVSKIWVTDEVKQSSAQLKDLYILQKKYPILGEYYKIRKRDHQQFVEKCKHNHYDNIIQNSENKSKISWSIINELKGKSKPRSNIKLLHENEEITSPVDVANTFNNFFIDAPKKVIHNIPDLGGNVATTQRNIITSMVILPFTELEIKDIFTKLKNKRSSGPDDLPNNIIKEFKEDLVKPFCHIINSSMETGVFPKSLKIAKVIPLHKKNAKNLSENYRPLSLTSVFAKLFEYCMLERLTSFIVRFNLIPDEQHGFRKSKSTTTATTETYIDILTELDKKRCPIGIYCDLSKAFDCVPHDRLLEKLWIYGIRGNTHQWFRSYLDGRKQYVQISHIEADGQNSMHCSDLKSVNVGVPQGSVLAPILFSLYIADIVKYLDEYKLTLYADDLSILVAKDSLETIQQNCDNLMTKIILWFSTNKLYVNSGKTYFSIFHSRQKRIENIEIKMGEVNLKQCENIKFLGIIMNDTLDWENHIRETISKLNSKIYQLKCLRRVLNLSVLTNFYYAEIQSRLTYGILLWGSTSAAQKLFILQKKCLRTLLNKSQRESCRPLFTKLKILPLSCLYILEISCYIFKNKTNINTHSNDHSYSTRFNHHLKTPQNNLNVTLKGPISNGIRIYNKLPEAIKREITDYKFRKHLKTLLLSKMFYSTEEYYAS